MPKFETSTPVGQWVTECPRTARVFENLQIDYCCGGGKSLKEACALRHLDPSDVISLLHQTIADTASVDANNSSQPDWAHASLTELCDHIEQTHHAYLKAELPRLTLLLQQVAGAHGARHAELYSLQDVFSRLRSELEPHLFKEEQILFPAIRQLEQSVGHSRFPFGSIANPIRKMEHEHDQAGQALQEIRDLTGNFTVPEDACNTWRVMCDGLRNLEADLHQHIHK
ncbi:MAG: iron-sulfur cluster repair di-iron protein, partial [Planctomycetaceae bacterium]